MATSRIRWVMRWVGPLLLIWVVWRYADLRTLADTLARARVWPLVIAVALDSVVIHAKLWRWRSLLRSAGVSLSVSRAYMAFLPSLYLGLATPGRVGDALRIQYLKRDHAVGYADGLAVSIIDRLCDVYVLLAFVSLGIVHLARTASVPFAQTTWLAVVAVAIAPAFLFARGVAEPAAQWLYGRFSKGQVHEGLSTFFDALRGQIGWSLAGPAFLTVLAFLTNYLQAWLVANALGSDLGVIDVASLVAASSLLGLLPISISGVGVRESFFALIFPAFGFAATLGIAFGLGVFAAIYLPAMLVGLIAWLAWPPST
jgi:hypothetical protein